MKENHYEKYKFYWTSYRLRLREKLGETEYLRLMADKMKYYLDRNPEKRLELNDLNKKNLDRITYVYRKSAEKRNINFELSKEKTKELLDNECFYCKDIALDGYHNGIDRKNNDDGYNLDNCVTCCKICNYAKGDLVLDEFIGKIYHILSYIGIIKEKHDYNELFKNHNSLYKYSRYKYRANKKNEKKLDFEFEITQEHFIMITSMNCYLCGKENSEIHNNGIDRIDNNRGYIFSNILSCCGDCNYLKNKYDINELMIKFYQIYLKRKLNDQEKKNLTIKIDKYIKNCLEQLDIYINDNINDVARIVFRSYNNKFKDDILLDKYPSKQVNEI